MCLQHRQACLHAPDVFAAPPGLPAQCKCLAVVLNSRRLVQRSSRHSGERRTAAGTPAAATWPRQLRGENSSGRTCRSHVAPATVRGEQQQAQLPQPRGLARGQELVKQAARQKTGTGQAQSAPPTVCGENSSGRTCRSHLASPEDRNWSKMICAPLAKSPNCASQITRELGFSIE